MLLSPLALEGCALWTPLPRHETALDHVAFLAQVLEADDRARESLWKAAQAASGSDEAELRTALLQSVPGHSGFNPLAAHAALTALATNPGVSRDVAAVARLRLADADADAALGNEVIELRQRMARVAEIEKRQTGRR